MYGCFSCFSFSSSFFFSSFALVWRGLVERRPDDGEGEGESGSDGKQVVSKALLDRKVCAVSREKKRCCAHKQG